MSKEREDLFLKYLKKDLIPYMKPTDCCEDIIKLRKENEHLTTLLYSKENIIKEVRELCLMFASGRLERTNYDDILEILDKEK